MSKSLQEQLLQAGAAKPKQAKKARREKVTQDKAARKQGKANADDTALQQQIAAAQAKKKARDQQLNAEQKAQREQRELAHSVGQIIERNQMQPEADGADSVAYSYTIDKQIHRIEVSDAQRGDLASGRLAIVRYNKASALIPKLVAERLMEKIPEQIWLVSTQDQASDADDPYAAYQVPDDLVW